MNKIVIIGAGNMATNLSFNFQKNGFNILQIYSRTLNYAKKLAEKLGVTYTDNFEEIEQFADFYIICVSDNAISEILEKIDLKNKFLIHTAGSVDLKVFEKHTENFGVFYPLQSLKKDFVHNFKEIPICVEANNLENQNILMKIANQISDNVRIINSEQRRKIHLAAVFANNFTNYILACAYEFCDAENIDFNIYKPLINNTINRAFEQNPINNQTGPAIRGDEQTIKKHLEMLKNYTELKKIHKFVSKKINKDLKIK